MRLCAKSRMSAEDLSARPAVKIKLCLLKSNRSYPLSAVPTVLWKRPLLGYAGMDCWKGMSSAAARVTYKDFQATSAIREERPPDFVVAGLWQEWIENRRSWMAPNLT